MALGASVLVTNDHVECLSRGLVLIHAGGFGNEKVGCDMSRTAKSKRRSSSSMERSSAMGEGEGRVGSDGPPFSLARKGSSRRRKSWAWVSNSGFWSAVVAKSAGLMAVGGAGGEGEFAFAACLCSSVVFNYFVRARFGGGEAVHPKNMLAAC